MNAPADNCGNCVTEECSEVVRPYGFQINDDTGEVRAWYCCPGCRHRWWTSWDARSAGTEPAA